MKFLLKESYLKAVENSVGSKLFRNLYYKVNGKKSDILISGVLSCAVFVSWILKNFELIKEGHATVDGAIKDLKKSSWKKIRKPKIGAVLVWEEQYYDSGPHKHIGFYIGNNKAVSNSLRSKVPAKHHWTFGSKNDKNYRKVIEIWWHKKLN
ncbi:MAG: hypothetical protein G01um101444_456 [Parcubacteria group bacterium Gr01-1014_44]|nr:MAG: hypothetical protein G01um101444_456 [Parcubacteria group bacterium Gr01-1014_44]